MDRARSRNVTFATCSSLTFTSSRSDIYSIQCFSQEEITDRMSMVLLFVAALLDSRLEIALDSHPQGGHPSSDFLEKPASYSKIEEESHGCTA
jgi:hypothetical protein